MASWNGAVRKRRREEEGGCVAPGETGEILSRTGQQKRKGGEIGEVTELAGR